LTIHDARAAPGGETSTAISEAIAYSVRPVALAVRLIVRLVKLIEGISVLDRHLRFHARLLGLRRVLRLGRLYECIWVGRTAGSAGRRVRSLVLGLRIGGLVLRSESRRGIGGLRLRSVRLVRIGVLVLGRIWLLGVSALRLGRELGRRTLLIILLPTHD